MLILQVDILILPFLFVFLEGDNEGIISVCVCVRTTSE